MQLGSHAQIPDGLLAEIALLSENSHQGVPSRESAPHQGIDERNCTALLGLRFRSSEIVSGTVVAPSTGTIKPLSRLACASMVADGQYSIAANTSGSSPNNPIVKAFLGNAVSGIVNLFTTNDNPLTNLATGGWNPGIPGIPAPQIGGVALDGGLTGAATRVVAGAAADTIGLVKLGYDAATFGYAYVHNCP